jgi:hypothetical protein
MGHSARRWPRILPGLLCGVVAIAALFYFGVEAFHQRELKRHRSILADLLGRAPTVEQIDAEPGF